MNEKLKSLKVWFGAIGFTAKHYCQWCGYYGDGWTNLEQTCPKCEKNYDPQEKEA